MASKSIGDEWIATSWSRRKDHRNPLKSQPWKNQTDKVEVVLLYGNMYKGFRYAVRTTVDCLSVKGTWSNERSVRRRKDFADRYRFKTFKQALKAASDAAEKLDRQRKKEYARVMAVRKQREAEQKKIDKHSQPKGST